MSNTSLDPPNPVLHPLEVYKIKSLPPNAYYIPSFLTPTESTTLLSQISKHPWTTLTHRRLQPHPAPLTPSGHLLTTKSLPEFLVTPVVDRILSLSFTSSSISSSSTSESNNSDTKNIGTKTTEGIFTKSPHSRPNHVLINEYPPGTGIPPHEDGGAYFPVVCTVSLGAHIILQVTPKKKMVIDHNNNNSSKEGEDGENGSSETITDDNNDNNKNDDNDNIQTTVYKIFQEPNSLLITTDDIYTEHLHGIEAVKVDEGLTDQMVANWELLSEETRRRIVEGGGKVEREEVRISLTYRDVLKVKDAGKLFGGRALGRR
ncbi:hypothetical protein AOL_s00054g313 [Orbilia oligospora ATCC 24927]|uniref:Fe2OG dioxygenase domain-containing protein n=2 Tax=Orbilia oligospora TaxID=2813651 RepID=G1X619_ARTOA|nr:hypothetical protein AOL_s00054g313 [Orbilia oligospora ATCC 24927]EGX51614.1 hypothetical protein AOL_s00054g313 [Orbilia oligospora ATCC 24927]KAF3274697.1 hypothetical protein TWF970_007683 [Orbilia oligospora]